MMTKEISVVEFVNKLTEIGLSFEEWWYEQSRMADEPYPRRISFKEWMRKMAEYLKVINHDIY